MTRPHPLLPVLPVLLAAACAGARRERSARVDEVVSRSPGEEAAWLRAEAMRPEEERQEAIRRAPKRAVGDPLEVAVLPMDVAPELREAIGGRASRAFREGVGSDPVLRLVPSKAAARAGQAARRSGHRVEIPADALVESRAYLQETFGVSERTGELARGVRLVCEATVTSAYLPWSVELEEEGSPFDEEDVIGRLAWRVRRAILDEIGPTVPADGEHLRKPRFLDAGGSRRRGLEASRGRD